MLSIFPMIILRIIYTINNLEILSIMTYLIDLLIPVLLIYKFIAIK